MILALETSTPRASLALWDEAAGEVTWRTEFSTDRAHNAVIFAPVTEALSACGGRLDGIAVGLGPGSYSGVRVGIAVANGLSLALDVPVVGVSSLEAYDGDLSGHFVVGDARRKTRFLARLVEGRLAGEPELIPEEEFSTRLLRETGWNRRGDRVELSSEEGALPGPTLSGPRVFTPDERVASEVAGIEVRFPASIVVARRGACELSRGCGNTSLEPHYLRPPYITTPKSRKG